MHEVVDHRRLIARTGLCGLAAAGALASAPLPAMAAEKNKKPEVTPPEDLMREHGVLDRVLLIYEAGRRKFTAKDPHENSALSALRFRKTHQFPPRYAVFPAITAWPVAC